MREDRSWRQSAPGRIRTCDRSLTRGGLCRLPLARRMSETGRTDPLWAHSRASLGQPQQQTAEALLSVVALLTTPQGPWAKYIRGTSGGTGEYRGSTSLREVLVRRAEVVALAGTRRAPRTTCHAEGRGFESHQPLVTQTSVRSRQVPPIPLGDGMIVIPIALVAIMIAHA
jgi:hypothetical protein